MNLEYFTAFGRSSRAIKFGVLSILTAAIGNAYADSAQQAEPAFSDVKQITRASTLIGRTLENTADEEVGKVVDIAINPATGQVGYLVIETNRGNLFNKKQERFLAVSLDEIAISADPEARLVFDVPSQTMVSAPAFSKADWPLQANFTSVDTTVTPAVPEFTAGVDAEAGSSLESDDAVSEEAVDDVAQAAVDEPEPAALAEDTVESSQTIQTEEVNVAATAGEAPMTDTIAPADAALTDSAVEEATDAELADAESVGMEVASPEQVEESAPALQPMPPVVAAGTAAPAAPPAETLAMEPESEAFRALDTNADGFVSRDELGAEAEQMSAADANADDKLDQVEFASFEAMEVAPEAGASSEPATEAPASAANPSGTKAIGQPVTSEIQGRMPIEERPTPEADFE